jgi:hypothetical protein
MVCPQRTCLHARIDFMSHFFTKEGKLSKMKRLKENDVEQMFTSWCWFFAQTAKYVVHAAHESRMAECKI